MKNKYNINVNPPPLSTEQIKKHQDFDQLFKQYEQQMTVSDEPVIRAVDTSKNKSNWVVRYGTTAMLAIAASIVLVFMFKEVAFFEEIPNSQISETFTMQSPMPSFDIPYGDLIVKNATLGETLQYKSGSKIVVPPAAFVDQQGVPVQGSVQIKYREFNNHVDMFLAGVPKEIDQHQNLQSVGMMEIKGFKDGKPVYLAQDKTLDVALHGTAIEGIPTANLDVFVFSNEKDIWQYRADDQVEIVDNGRANIPSVMPSDDSFVEQANLMLASSKPTKPLKVGVPDNMVLFNFDINIEEYPSLAKYDENIHFLAEEDKDGDLIYDYEWNSMDLEPSEEHEYILTLSRSEDNQLIEHQVKIWPALKATELSKKIYAKQMAQYEAQIKQWNSDVLAYSIQIKEEMSSNSEVVKNKIINRFSINRFGIWNCGKAVELENQQSELTDFVNEEGTKVLIKQLFISNKKEQLYYSVNKQAKINSLRLDISDQSKVWALTEDNEFWVLQESSTQANKLTYQLEAVGKIENEAAIRSLLTF
jgi:hypothetical protein